MSYHEGSTARKKQPATLEAKMGFQDHDLKTPAHDKIMMWLTEEVTKIERIKEFIDWKPEWDYEDPIKGDEERGSKPPRPEPYFNKSIWELPVNSGNFTAGFIDLAVQYTHSRICRNYVPKTWSIGESWVQIAFEVKSKITSVGEVIRQIRFYEHKARELHFSKFYIVAPDPGQAIIKLIRDQGIGFLEVPAQVVAGEKQ